MGACPSGRRSHHATLLVLCGLLRLVAGYVVPSYVRTYAPLLWLHSDDPFMPSDILGHVLHTKPYTGFQPMLDAPEVDLDNLSLLNINGDGVYLTSADNVTTNPEWFLGETPDAKGALHNSTACAVVVVDKTETEADVFYFYFYSYNQGADITQVLPPLDRILPESKAGDHFGNHVGDWEHNMIRFQNGQPTGIYYSQHTSGEVCLWDDEACSSKQGDRPVVYSARGSHANYPSTGSHIHDEALIDIANKGRLWDPINPAYFYHYDPATDALTPAEPGTAPTDWFHFSGAWGDKQYADSDPRQKTVPYFGLKKYNDGPTGPKSKHLVRQGLSPDEKPGPNLMKTLVRMYLSMYGCCWKGHSPWAVGIGVLLVLAVVTFLIVFTARKLWSCLRKRRLRTRHVEKNESSVWLRLQSWFTKKRWQRQRRQQEDTSEFSLRLLDPERGEDEREAERQDATI